jgi:F-type H+-transporting ATPase subunit b
MQVVENIALISINATLFVQLGSFLIFMVILNRVMVRPLRKTITDRNSHVQQVIQEIQAAELAYDDLNRHIEAQENKLRKSALRVQRRMEDEGQHKADEIVAQARKEISEMRQKAQKENEAKITVARQQVESEAGPIADQMIAALLGQRSPS